MKNKFYLENYGAISDNELLVQQVLQNSPDLMKRSFSVVLKSW